MSKVIVITGAGAGLGRQLARSFADDGETVVLLGRTLSKLETLAAEIGDAATPVACDVGSPDSVREAFAAIGEKHGRIDVLINSAAVYEPFLVENASDDQILLPIMTNLAGTVFTCRAAIPLMGVGGHIINLSSESVDMLFPHLTLYQATKAGIERFSKSMMSELEDKGIRVTCVRAGQMADEDKSWDVDPVAAMAFAEATAKVGLKLGERPITHYKSMPGLFRALVDLPEGLHVGLVTLHARRPDA